MPRFLLCLLLMLSIAGCGYTTGSLLPKNYHKIAIQPFQNKVSYVNEDIQGVYSALGLARREVEPIRFLLLSIFLAVSSNFDPIASSPSLEILSC